MIERRCDRCGEVINSCTSKWFVFERYYVKVSSEDMVGRRRDYDLCDRCAKLIENTIKVGVKSDKRAEA